MNRCYYLILFAVLVACAQAPAEIVGQSRQELAGTNLAGTNLSFDGTGLLYSGEDTRTGDRCISLGVSAPGFASLVLAQGSSDVQAAVGKLPWSLNATDGATLAAWEVLVWGSASYCDFVVAAPPATAWAGVAGFFKAMFRWNAPTSQSIHLIPIVESASVDATIAAAPLMYPGMMGAASLWQDGTLPDLSFVAGELAFISSTTNNRSVLVDFASWALDKDGNGVVLGNVDADQVPTFVESVWSASVASDGSIHISVDDPARGVALPDGMTSVTQDIGSAYQACLDGQGSLPLPKRCAPALYLQRAFGTALEEGKCDNGLSWPEGSCVSGAQPWSAVTGLLGPNLYMLLPEPGAEYRRGQLRDGSCDLLPVVGETYVHTWSSEYDLGPACQ